MACAGENVTIIARGDRAGYLQQNGITITGLFDFTVACPVITNPADLREADVLIVAVKTYHMAVALATLRHLDVATVLSVQNVVLKNEWLADMFGPEKTVGTAAFFRGEVLPEGSVRFIFNRGFYVGEIPEGRSERVAHLAGMLARAGIQAEATAHIQTVEWWKFVGWIGPMVLSVLTRLETYKFLTDPDTALVCARLMRETALLARVQDIPLEDRPPFPIKTICSGTESEAVEALRELGATMQAQAPTHRVSGLQDLERGRRLEVEETLGYVVAKAATATISVPTVDMCCRLISGIDRFI